MLNDNRLDDIVEKKGDADPKEYSRIRIQIWNTAENCRTFAKYRISIKVIVFKSLKWVLVKTRSQGWARILKGDFQIYSCGVKMFFSFSVEVASAASTSSPRRRNRSISMAIC
jgi:hypothetical protein